MLENYNRKRNFKETPEPSGNNNNTDKNFNQNIKADSNTNTRFVIQKHDATRLHYDFRLESKKNKVLISWAIPKGPSTDPKIKRLAILTEDHPVDYLLFEGNIPKGNYGAGSVIVWDSGTYSIEVTEYNDEDVSDQFNREKINFTLFGQKLKGKFSLIKTSRQNQWLLVKVNDRFAFQHDKGKKEANTDLTKSNPDSVLSGLTNDDLKKANKNKFLKESNNDHKIRTDNKKNTISEINNNTDNNNTNSNRSNIVGSHIKSHSFTAFNKQEFPNNLMPMLATLLNRPFNSQDWFFEIKWDGVRALSFIHKSKGISKIQSRSGNIISQRYPELIEPLKSAIDEQNCKESIVFDGEIVVLDKKGFPDFKSHQKRMNINLKRDIEMLSSQFPATYYIFDILYLDGFDLKSLALVERREILNGIIRKDKSNKRIKISDFIDGEGNDIFESIKKMNLEGMIAKHKLGKYHTGSRSKEWLKIKNTKTQDCVVIGFTRGEGNRKKYFGSLLLAAVDNNKSPNENKLKFVGHSGSGFDFSQLPNIYNTLKKITIEKCPIDYVPYTNREAIWVKPVLVVEIKFSDWTGDKIMRAPIFLGFREDKNPQDCVMEENKQRIYNDVFVPRNEINYNDNNNFKDNKMNEIAPKPVSPSKYNNFSNLEKTYWGKTNFRGPITKKDLIEYYDKISPFILPHLKDRPLSLNRYPDGIGGKSFYHKNWQNEKPDYVKTIKIYSKSRNEYINYILCNNKETLLWLANLGCIEMHPWYSRVNNYVNDNSDNSEIDNYGLNHPDFIVFDLDPYIYSGNEGKYQEPEYNVQAFRVTVETAYHLKDIFDKINIESFIKTSGKTGLHIFIPIINLYTYEQTRSFAQIIGKMLIKRLPSKVTTEWNTDQRKGKIFFDYNQNSRGKTIASIFSPRPVNSATISMPVEWINLKNTIRIDYTITNVPEILEIKKDPWADILNKRQDLAQILDNISEVFL